MSVASLFEPVQGHDRSRVAALVEKLVKSCREDNARLVEYEREFGPSLKNEQEDESAERVLRTLWELFSQWVVEAEQVLTRVRELEAAGHPVAEANGLRDDYGFARARLMMTPESTIRAVRQSRRGECIPVEVVRDELRRRRGA